MTAFPTPSKRRRVFLAGVAHCLLYTTTFWAGACFWWTCDEPASQPQMPCLFLPNLSLNISTRGTFFHSGKDEAAITIPSSKSISPGTHIPMPMTSHKDKHTRYKHNIRVYYYEARSLPIHHFYTDTTINLPIHHSSANKGINHHFSTWATAACSVSDTYGG